MENKEIYDAFTDGNYVFPDEIEDNLTPPYLVIRLAEQCSTFLAINQAFAKRNYKKFPQEFEKWKAAKLAKDS